MQNITEMLNFQHNQIESMTLLNANDPKSYHTNLCNRISKEYTLGPDNRTKRAHGRTEYTTLERYCQYLFWREN